MASPPPPPPPPVGEDNWIDFIDQQSRHADTLEKRIQIIELFRTAVAAEPGSIKVWIAYCEYFWSLYQDCQPLSDAGWPQEERAAGREIFSLDSALHLWSQGHEATKYRIGDSHELWDRWISLEKELLDRTRTAEGVKRISHLYRNRLLIPHATWDNTSQMFSSFLSEYNPAGYEETMQEVTTRARDAKKLYEQRDHLELKLRRAISSGKLEAEKEAMAEYINWEIANTRKERKDQASAIQLGLGLFSRALTGVFATDEATWSDFVVYVSHLHSVFDSGIHKNEELAHLLPNLLDVLQRAVQHCPWSGSLWARYILSGEEAGLSFSDIERIKHAATNSSQLDRDGMTAVVDMYAAWCGYLKRSAMVTNAADEAVDVADSGLVAALEAVEVWGQRRFGDSYQGDPSFRLERILIQYLTEKHAAIEEARGQWSKLATRELYANSYDFWLSYYIWEMLVFQAQKGKGRSPTPSAPQGMGLRVPTLATDVLERAIQSRKLDWPERVLEVYVNHCNDYQTSDTLRRALDTVHKVRKGVAKRREREAADAAAAYAAQVQQQQQQQQEAQSATEASQQPTSQESPSGSKRKRATSPEEEASANLSKRAKSEAAVDNMGASAVQSQEQQEQGQPLKRDRENSSVYVTNLPVDVTATKVKAYFKEYGHVNNIDLKKERDGKSSVALIEFRSVQDVQSALIRDNKYFDDRIISVKPAAGVTLYLTNFPPTANEAYIRDLFKGLGEIFSIRWPSLKYNTHRRFCYVSFREAEAAAKATKLDGKMLEGRYKLSVKYSNPGLKKAREGATDEGREVHVKNLDHDVDEETLKEVFGKYGNVTRVNLLRAISGQSRGSAFVVFEKKEEAEKAVAELDKAKLKSRILSVEVSQPSNYKPQARATAGASASPPPPNGQDVDSDKTATERGSEPPRERTFALLGIPDTVNLARVQTLVEPHGKIVKIVLRLDHSGAIVEFADAATAGKAQLALEGAELDGRKLRVGTVAELFKEKGGKRNEQADKAPSTGGSTRSSAALMPPPQHIKRPGQSKGGPKRGLGFVAAAKSGNAGAGNGVPPVVNGDHPTKKSNADFRNLFLGIGSNKKDSGSDKDKDTSNSNKMDVDTAQNGH